MDPKSQECVGPSERKIGAEVLPLPLHLRECGADLGYRPGDPSNADRAAGENLSIPVDPEFGMTGARKL